jgi:hypothetical protein
MGAFGTVTEAAREQTVRPAIANIGPINWPETPPEMSKISDVYDL